MFWLFLMAQRYKFESKSQLAREQANNMRSCF